MTAHPCIDCGTPVDGTPLPSLYPATQLDLAMTADTDTDHDRTTCGHPWCRAHQPCTCPFASITPHLAAGCRQATDVEETHDAPR